MKLRKNGFPLAIPKYLSAESNPKSITDIKSKLRFDLKTWFKTSFQKDNRWNRLQIRRLTRAYSIKELKNLKDTFELLFDTDRKYNQSFVKYHNEIYAEKQAEKSGTKLHKIQITQKGYHDLLHFMGQLKESGNIKNTYKDLAACIHQSIVPDDPIQPITIIDRLRNQKGYR